MPFVWGPIGGGQFYNPIFKDAYFSRKDINKEKLRNFINRFYLIFSSDIKAAVKKANTILIADQLMDEALVKIADAFTPTVDIVCGDCLWIDAERNLQYIRKSKMQLKKLKYEMVLMHPTCFVRRTAYEKWGGFDINLSFKVVFITIGIIYTISYVLCVDKSYVSIERDSLFKWIYYFAVMMLGFYCKKMKRSNAQNKVGLLIVCSAMFVIFYGLQFVIKRCTVLLPFQFIIHVEEVVFIYYITYLFENLESFFIEIKHKTAISKIADSLAKITLEIYLVQMVVIDLCAEHLAFPLSFVVAVVGIYVYAIIVNSISTQVRRIVEKIVIRKKKAKI